MRARFVVIAVLVLANRSWAQPLHPGSAQEIWETVFARDNAGRDHQIGYSRVLLENTQVDGAKVIRATRELRITIKRDGQLAQLKADTGTVETPEGRVIGVFMRHWIGEKQALVLTGKLEEATFARRNLI